MLDDYVPKNSQQDDEVIFVRETIAERRIMAVVDLCTSDAETPERVSTKRGRQQAAYQSGPSSLECKLIPDFNGAAGSSTSVAAERPNVEERKTPQIQCPICLDEFPLNSIWTTYCGHGFCEPCIRNCIQTRKKCPTCNTKCNVKQIHRLFIQ